MRYIEGPSFEWKGKLPTTTTTAEALITSAPMSLQAAGETDEALIDDNNLRPIAFLELGVRLSHAVAQIVVPGLGLGTGFLIASNLILTNHHVIGNQDDANNSLARFNYEIDVDGQLLTSAYYKCDASVFFLTNEALDFTIVGTQGDPGIRFGFISLSNGTPGIGDRVNIIQHPLGQPKQIAMVDNQIAYADATVLQYLTDTLPGSSGSPVFDDDWRIVALHHSGGWIPEPNSESTHFRNEGIYIGAIGDSLRAAGVM